MSGRRLLFAALLLTLCIAYVPMRGELGGEALLGDALEYVALIDGTRDVEAPYRYRVVVPFIARMLPLSAPRALICVSWLSLFATYALILHTSERLRISFGAAACGLTVAVFSAPHLYNYTNPFLTDAMGLLMVAASLHALLLERYVLFCALSALAIGVREASIFTSLAWAEKKLSWRAVVAVACALAVYVGTRVLIGQGSHIDEGPFAIFPAHPLRALVREALSAWHMLWLIASLGLSMLVAQRRAVLFTALLLFAGGVITSLLATDTTRMFQPLFVVVAIGVARFVEVSWRCSRAATASFIATCLASSWVWQPVRLLPQRQLVEAHQLEANVALLCLVASGLFALLKMWSARRPVSEGFVMSLSGTEEREG